MNCHSFTRVAITVCLIWASLFCNSFLPVLSESPKKVCEKKYEILVVLIYDKNCKDACTKVRPIMAELAPKYGEKLKYIELDGSSDELNKSLKAAAEFGVKRYLEDSTELAPIVGVFNTRGNKLNELRLQAQRSVRSCN